MVTTPKAARSPDDRDNDHDRQLERQLLAQVKDGDDAAVVVLTDLYKQRGLSSREELWKWICDGGLIR